MSDDGRSALSVIAMLGSVFSPFYAAARARLPAAADPLSHVALNVALYAPRRSWWALTERGRRSLARGADALVLGPSALRWEGGSLVVDLAERTAPMPRRIEGRIRLIPEEASGETTTLDAAGRHRWIPIAPVARAEVELTHPSIRWSGPAYLDANTGDEGLEHAFTGWTWSRVASGRRTTVTYEIERRDGARVLLARAFEKGGERRSGFPVVSIGAPSTRWRMRRAVHAEPGGDARVARTLEDTPFYARSLIETTFFGERAAGVHETLSLDRFTSPIVQRMIPYRMRRELA